jgi:hypothetical protein
MPWQERRTVAYRPCEQESKEIVVAMIGFLNKAFTSDLLTKTLEDYYAEIIGRAETRRRTSRNFE